MSDDPNANNAPGIDPANIGSLAGFCRELLTAWLRSEVDDMLPAQVLAYDRKTNLAQVKPMVRMVTTNGQQLSRASVASVPVLVMGGGNCLLSFPLKAGDIGWIKASDRDISLFMQHYAEAIPNTKRMHKFEDGLFIPDLIKNFTIADEDADNVVLQWRDSSTRIALGSDKVKITAGDSYWQLTKDEIHWHAAKKIGWDVDGYGESIESMGGGMYTKTTWQEGATVTTLPMPISPPEGGKP